MIVRYLLKQRPFPRAVAQNIFLGKTSRFRVAAMSTSSPPKLQHVAIDTEEGIAIIKYNRPKSGNALNTPTLKVSFGKGMKTEAHLHVGLGTVRMTTNNT